MQTTYGTANFVSEQAAVKYYRPYGYQNDEYLDETAKFYIGRRIMESASRYLLSEGILVPGLWTGMGEIERILAVRFA